MIIYWIYFSLHSYLRSISKTLFPLILCVSLRLYFPFVYDLILTHNHNLNPCPAISAKNLYSFNKDYQILRFCAIFYIIRQFMATLRTSGFILCDSRLNLLTSRFVLHDPRLTLRTSWFILHNFRLITFTSRFVLRDSRLISLTSRFVLHDSRLTLRFSRFALRNSRLTLRDSWLELYSSRSALQNSHLLMFISHLANKSQGYGNARISFGKRNSIQVNRLICI